MTKQAHYPVELSSWPAKIGGRSRAFSLYKMKKPRGLKETGSGKYQYTDVIFRETKCNCETYLVS